MNFRVELATYRGPLDLLLYLVRRQELDIVAIPIASLAEQYLQYLGVLNELDVEGVGDFVETASILLEVKSQILLPQGGEEVETLEDPRDELVQRLLDYKKYRDAASLLDEQSRAWQQRYARQANDLPPRQVDPETQPIQEVELWDLVSAFGRILRESLAVQPSSIVYDDTPLHVYMQRIRQRLLRQRCISLSNMFEPGMHKSAIIGVFLAILELVRHRYVLADQPELHGEILILPGEDFDGASRFFAADHDCCTARPEGDVLARPR